MPLQLEDSDQESRTASIGSKRRARRDRAGGYSSSGTSIPRKKLKRDRRPYHVNDWPKGGNFRAMSSLPPQLSENMKASTPVEISDDSASSRESSQVQKSRLLPTMNWNAGVNNVIRTSLQGSGSASEFASSFNPINGPIPQAPIGLDNDEEDDGEDSSHESWASEESDEDKSDDEIDDHTDGVPRESTKSSGHTENDAVSISDDSDLGSEDDTGIMLNMETKNGQNNPLEISDTDHGGSESGEIESSDDSPQVSTAIQAEVDLASAAVKPEAPKDTNIAQFDGAPGMTRTAGKILGDLNSHDLEQQITYAYYYLPRDQLDLGKPVYCLLCFQEGHMASSCGLNEVSLPSNIPMDLSNDWQCEHCGARNKHQSRFCPTHRRCLRCRERGHDKEQCSSKLLETTIPCDLCNSFNHLEDKCPMVWMQSTHSNPGPMALNISCCNCASKTHLVGDCPALGISQRRNLFSWSLQALDPAQITNLTLQPDYVRSEKALGNFGAPPLRIKGRADRFPGGRPMGIDNYEDADGSDEDQFFRARVPRSPAGHHIRFGDNSSKTRDDSLGHRLDASGYDSYQSDRQSYRDRRDDGRAPNPFDYRRPRSRSPPSRSSYGGRGGNGAGDRWQPPPPLPRGGPPPTGPSGKSNKNRSNGESYRPMPSAGKKNWDRYRLGG